MCRSVFNLQISPKDSANMVAKKKKKRSEKKKKKKEKEKRKKKRIYEQTL
jgi:hypothetical protein